MSDATINTEVVVDDVASAKGGEMHVMDGIEDEIAMNATTLPNFNPLFIITFCLNYKMPKKMLMWQMSHLSDLLH
jgi:hypothetical protein